MNKYVFKILNYLLEKYERSVLSKQGSNLNLQIKVKITKLFSKYNDSDYYVQRLLIDEACYYLNDLQLIIISVDDGISEISLSLIDKHIKKAYQLVNRIYLPDYRQETISFLKSICFSKDWLNVFRNEMINKLENYQSINKYLSIDNNQEIRDIS